MKIPCSYSGCSDRRLHHERPYENRPHVMIEVPDDWTGYYYFCSFECACYAGKFNMRKGWIHDQEGKTYLDTWLEKERND